MVLGEWNQKYLVNSLDDCLWECLLHIALCHQKIYSSPQLWHLWMWNYLKLGLWRCNQIKMESFWIRWALIHHDWIIRRKETNVEKKGPCGKADINTELCCHKTAYQKLGRDKEVCSTRVYGESRELQIPWLQIAKFHNCKIINFSFSLSYPVYCALLQCSRN